jgi:uncharacterized protein YcbX
MIKITALYVYPIKSLKGITLQQADISETGIAYDRFWMLVNENGDFLSQREHAILALFKVSMQSDSFTVSFDEKSIKIPKTLTTKNIKECELWEEKLNGYTESDEINNWFSNILNIKVFLVRNSEQPKRTTKEGNDTYVNFTDSQQYLIIGQSSMDNLNDKLEQPINIDRFRPNIVFSISGAHEEDTWSEIQIGASTFTQIKPCGRCNVITINQDTAIAGKEPLKTLAKYRFKDNNVYFGQYLKLTESSNKLLQVGDQLTVLCEKEDTFLI